jgi:cobalt/nickel transport system permease protein
MHKLPSYKHDASNFLVSLDPRVKLLSASALLLMVISCHGFLFPITTAALCCFMIISLGVRPRLIIVRFAEPLFIAIMVVLLKLFFSGKVALFSFDIFGWQIAGHLDGLLEGLMIASRIAGAVTVVALLGFSTSFTDLMAALSWLRAPQGVVEVALFAWRYLFVLWDDAQVVYAAQKNRLGYAGFSQGFRSFGTLAGTLVVKAFDNSQTITTAMLQRGYDGSMPLLKQRPFRLTEVTGAFSLLVAMGLMWRI